MVQVKLFITFILAVIALVAARPVDRPPQTEIPAGPGGVDNRSPQSKISDIPKGRPGPLYPTPNSPTPKVKITGFDAPKIESDSSQSSTSSSPLLGPGTSSLSARTRAGVHQNPEGTTQGGNKPSAQASGSSSHSRIQPGLPSSSTAVKPHSLTPPHPGTSGETQRTSESILSLYLSGSSPPGPPPTQPHPGTPPHSGSPHSATPPHRDSRTPPHSGTHLDPSTHVETQPPKTPSESDSILSLYYGSSPPGPPKTPPNSKASSHHSESPPPKTPSPGPPPTQPHPGTHPGTSPHSGTPPHSGSPHSEPPHRPESPHPSHSESTPLLSAGNHDHPATGTGTGSEHGGSPPQSNWMQDCANCVLGCIHCGSSPN